KVNVPGQVPGPTAHIPHFQDHLSGQLTLDANVDRVRTAGLASGINPEVSALEDAVGVHRRQRSIRTGNDHSTAHHGKRWNADVIAVHCSDSEGIARIRESTAATPASRRKRSCADGEISEADSERRSEHKSYAVLPLKRSRPAPTKHRLFVSK